jgi:hypothetical protein
MILTDSDYLIIKNKNQLNLISYIFVYFIMLYHFLIKIMILYLICFMYLLMLIVVILNILTLKLIFIMNDCHILCKLFEVFNLQNLNVMKVLQNDLLELLLNCFKMIMVWELINCEIDLLVFLRLFSLKNFLQLK